MSCINISTSTSTPLSSHLNALGEKTFWDQWRLDWKETKTPSPSIMSAHGVATNATTKQDYRNGHSCDSNGCVMYKAPNYVNLKRLERTGSDDLPKMSDCRTCSSNLEFTGWNYKVDGKSNAVCGTPNNNCPNIGNTITSSEAQFREGETTYHKQSLDRDKKTFVRFIDHVKCTYPLNAIKTESHYSTFLSDIESNKIAPSFKDVMGIDYCFRKDSTGNYTNLNSPLCKTNFTTPILNDQPVSDQAHSRLIDYCFENDKNGNYPYLNTPLCKNYTSKIITGENQYPQLMRDRGYSNLKQYCFPNDPNDNLPNGVYPNVNDPMCKLFCDTFGSASNINSPEYSTCVSGLGSKTYCTPDKTLNFEDNPYCKTGYCIAEPSDCNIKRTDFCANKFNELKNSYEETLVWRVPQLSSISGSTYWTAQYDSAKTNFPNLPPIESIQTGNNEWWINQNPTCVGFSGNSTAQCDPSKLVCSGSGSTYGYGKNQMLNIQRAHENDGIHPSCPRNTLIEDDSYWIEQYNNAKTQIGMPPLDSISYKQNQWWINNMPTCVGNGANSKQCDSSKLVCSGLNDTYGFGGNQMLNVGRAYQNSGIHPNCPNNTLN